MGAGDTADRREDRLSLRERLPTIAGVKRAAAVNA